MFLPYRPLPIGDIQIQTSMTEPETQRLRELAEGKTVLEIGSAYGWSTCNIAQAAKHVVAVDVHDESAAHAAPNSLNMLTFNLETLGLADKVIIKAGWSRGVLPKLQRDGMLFDGVFVDGDHSYEGCAYDLEMGWRMLRHGGFLAVHDYDLYGHCPDVKPAVDAFAEGLRVLAAEVTDTLWVVRKR
jgi:predicted O-methyltransferase YrrM